ncbi:guanosine monophosphate reductase [candidate division WWE3 bacterium]|uniref:Guanosine monophosphate reductase n=1 Tax=candidate division WWE3 bacterium TaxID=2053526 RepID=A0A955EAU2_UNCKA|nr:guanosine monophosphate reductase [candidate division WWE3 bacterium]
MENNNTLQCDTQFQTALSFEDVLLVPQGTSIRSRTEIDLTTKISDKLTLDIPLITTKMDTITGVDMATKIGKLGGMGILPRFDKEDIQAENVAKVKQNNVVVGAAIGCTGDYLKRAEMLVNAGVDVLNTDVAHGHLQINIDAIKTLKEKYGNKITIIGGICATYECAVAMYENGADMVSVGIGGGSICTTRIQTGCGLPTFQSLLEVAKAARKYNKTFQPEAGIRNSGDIVKSLATGASAIMGGSIFAGTDECPGSVISIDGVLYKEYSGSASEKEKQRQVNKDSNGKGKMYIKHVEGVAGIKPYRGPVEDVVISLLAGVRSGMSYCGAKNLQELWENARFVRITSAGGVESNHHDIIVQKDHIVGKALL